MMEDFDWNINNEAYLLEAMVGSKPIGVSRHFQMLCIWEKFGKLINREVPPAKIWEHLSTMYDIDSIEENEDLPFPNDVKDFTLPDTEYQILKLKREEKFESEKKVQKSRESIKKEIKKEEGIKTPTRLGKEKDNVRRDSKDKDASKESKISVPKKEVKKEMPESRSKNSKSRNSLVVVKDESKTKVKREESPARPPKRPTRGSLKPDDSNSSGKASPLTVTPSNKRRRI